jgi:hypothetical protein
MHEIGPQWLFVGFAAIGLITTGRPPDASPMTCQVVAVDGALLRVPPAFPAFVDTAKSVTDLRASACPENLT